MSKKVFILGCSGAIGSRLTSSLLEYGYRVYGVRGSSPCMVSSVNHFCSEVDLLDTTSTLDFNKLQPEILIHTAWETTPKLFWESPLNNEWTLASKKIIQLFKKSGGKYLVVTSSCAEYSWNSLAKLDEYSEVIPNSNYGKSKFQLLQWLTSIDLPFLWLRIFFQFGLSEPSGRLIPTMIDSILNGKIFEIENPYDVRDFVFIRDVVDVMKILIIQEQIGIVNIGTGTGLNLQSVGELIGRLTDRLDLVRFKTNYRKPTCVVSNPDKLISLIGNYNWTPIGTAILETIRIRLSTNF